MDFNQIKSFPVVSYITASLRCYLNPDMFYYAINSVTPYPSLHPAIQDLCFTSSQCLQERVEGKTNNPSVSPYTMCLSRFRALVFSYRLKILKYTVHFLVDYSYDDVIFCIDCPSQICTNEQWHIYQGHLFFIFLFLQCFKHCKKIKDWVVGSAPIWQYFKRKYAQCLSMSVWQPIQPLILGGLAEFWEVGIW